jgi:hypothetical protein
MTDSVIELTHSQAAMLGSAGPGGPQNFLALSDQPLENSNPEPLELTPELDAVGRLASAVTDLVFLTTTDPGSQQAAMSVVALGDESAMEVERTESGWEVTTPIALEAFTWRIADEIGAFEPASDEAPPLLSVATTSVAALMLVRASGCDLRESGATFEQAALSADPEIAREALADLLASDFVSKQGSAFERGPSLGAELLEIIYGARLTLRRSVLPLLIDDDAITQSSAFGEEISFAGAPGEMYYSFAMGETIVFTRIEEQSLAELLELATGSRTAAPVLPVAVPGKATIEALKGGADSPVDPSHDGWINNIGFATLEWQLESGVARDWVQALTRPELIATLETLGHDEDSDPIFSQWISIAGDAAVLWSESAAGVAFRTHRASDVRGEIVRWLDSQQAAGYSGRISMLARTDSGLVRGEEIELPNDLPVDRDQLLTALFDIELFLRED